MHTTFLLEDEHTVVTAVHNGDYSGDVRLLVAHKLLEGSRHEEVRVPFEALEKLVAKKYREAASVRVNSATDAEILRGTLWL